MSKQTMVYPYSRILLIERNKPLIQNYFKWSQKYYAEWKKEDSLIWLLFDSISMKLLKGQNLQWLRTCSVQFSSVAQSCPTLCDPVDCSPPGSSVHGILQPEIPEWVSSSRGASWPRVSCTAGSFLTACAIILNVLVLTLYPRWIVSVKGKQMIDSNRRTIWNLPFETSALPRGSNPLVCWDSC